MTLVVTQEEAQHRLAVLGLEVRLMLDRGLQGDLRDALPIDAQAVRRRGQASGRIGRRKSKGWVGHRGDLVYRL
jgi:hypothetical protein